ncbi:hypothetical protein ACFLTE_08790 [Bacteroidota bacterium]
MDKNFMVAEKIKPKNVLDFKKLALQCISDDKQLFKEELIRSIDMLTATDILILYNWLEENYLISHCEIINEVFYNID